MTIEYRVCWNASSNISFRGHDDWQPWDDDEATAEQVEDALTTVNGGGHIALPDGLEMALESSGFDWWIETREVQT